MPKGFNHYEEYLLPTTRERFFDLVCPTATDPSKYSNTTVTHPSCLFEVIHKLSYRYSALFCSFILQKFHLKCGFEFQFYALSTSEEYSYEIYLIVPIRETHLF